MRATLDNLLEHQVTSRQCLIMNLLRALSRFIVDTSYSKKCSSIERIEGSRESPNRLESASGTRSRQIAFGGHCVSNAFRERKAVLHLIWNHASKKRAGG